MAKIKTSTASNLAKTTKVDKKLVAKQVRVNNKSLRLLYKSSMSIGSTPEISRILESLVNCAKELTNAQKTAIALFRSDGKGKLNFNTMMIKGEKDELPDILWRDHLEKYATKAASKYQPIAVCEKEKMIIIPLYSKGHGIGVLAAFNTKLDKITEDDIGILCILANQTSIAIENGRLIRKEQRLAIALERERISREIHDGVAQSLFSIALNAEACSRMIDKKPESVKDMLGQLKEEALRSQKELRHLILDLKPGPLEELGLKQAVNEFLKNLAKNSETHIKSNINIDDNMINPISEISLYRIIQESASNTIKHASAKNLYIDLKEDSENAFLVMKDDGIGFNKEKVMSAERVDGLGLRNMMDRAKGAKGILEIESSPGHGTAIRATIPIGREGVGGHGPH